MSRSAESGRSSHGADASGTKEKIKSKGLTLETAFAGDEILIPKETALDIKLDDLVYYLTGQSSIPSYDARTRIVENFRWNSVREMLERTPKGPEAIRLRQNAIADLIAEDRPEAHEGRKAILSQGLEKVLTLLEMLGTDFPESLRTTNQWNEANAVLNFFTDAAAEIYFQKTEDFLKEISGSSFIGEIKKSIVAARAAFVRYRAELEKSDLATHLRVAGEARRTLKITKSDKEFAEAQKAYETAEGAARDAFPKLPKKGKEFEKFAAELYNLSKFISAALVVLERGLKRVEIVDENVFELHGARHPFLMQQLGKERTVPQDIHVSSGQPNVIMTGDNATGKSKRVETVLLNAPLAQSFGYALAEGGRYAPRSELAYVHTLNVNVEENQYSRGQKEMFAFVQMVQGLKKNSVVVMDEILTSTDSMGAIAIVLAVLEENGKNGGMSFLTIHSRDLEEIQRLGLAPSVQFLKPKEGEGGKKTFQWEEGVGRADPIALAKSFGLPENLLERAAKIKEALEK